MRIGELAEIAGVTTRTIRHYHHVGLLSEPVRRINGYRDYRLRDAVVLARIRRLAELGLSLDEIRDVLADDEGRELRDVLLELDADLARDQEAIAAKRGAAVQVAGGRGRSGSRRGGLSGNGRGAARAARRGVRQVRPGDAVAAPRRGRGRAGPARRGAAALYARLDALHDADPADPRVAELAAEMVAAIPDSMFGQDPPRAGSASWAWSCPPPRRRRSSSKSWRRCGPDDHPLAEVRGRRADRGRPMAAAPARRAGRSGRGPLRQGPDHAAVGLLRRPGRRDGGGWSCCCGGSACRKAVRLPLLALGVYGSVMVGGMIASGVVRPHVLTDTEFRIRFGHYLDVRVPIELVESVRRVEDLRVVAEGRRRAARRAGRLADHHPPHAPRADHHHQAARETRRRPGDRLLRRNANNCHRKGADAPFIRHPSIDGLFG